MGVGPGRLILPLLWALARPELMAAEDPKIRRAYQADKTWQGAPGAWRDRGLRAWAPAPSPKPGSVEVLPET